MAPTTESSSESARTSAQTSARRDQQRPPDPAELATRLVMLPAEVVWSMFGSVIERQLAALAAAFCAGRPHRPDPPLPPRSGGSAG